MNSDEMRQQVAHQKAVVANVLREILASQGCPCDWPQFEYWVSKAQGPGWQDGIQNDLVQEALNLPFYVRRPPTSPEYWLVTEIHCERCGAKWKYFSEEWRMLAFHERLIRQDRRAPDFSNYAGLIGANIYATVGMEPAQDIPRLSLEQWGYFMLGRPYETESAS